MSFVRRALNDQRGQTLPFVLLGMFAFMGVAGLSVDVGHAYVARGQMQGCANAAALAALPHLYNSNTTTTTTSSAVTDAADALSCSSGGDNYNPNLPNVTTTVTTPCINALLVTSTCAKTNNIPNAVRVKETAKVPTYFMKMLGMNSLQVGATATAAPNGPPSTPYNIAIILDSTGSMNTTDSNCGSVTEEQCAMNGIQQMLQNLNPCTVGGSCKYSDAATYVRVSLFAFPNVDSTTLSNDYSNSGSPTGQPYTLPVIPTVPAAGVQPSGYTPVQYKGLGSSSTKLWTGTYQITPNSADTTNIDAYGFTSGYHNASDTNSFDPTSILVKVLGNGTLQNGYMKEPSTNYTNYGPKGGANSGITYFAGAIYAAQAALLAEKAYADKIVGQTTQNVIIFVSDGQANAYSNQFPAYDGAQSVNNNPKTGPAIGIYDMDQNGAGVYPATTDPCQQAMIAGQYAKSQGTRVIGVAYGSESYGCTDTSLVSTSTIQTLIPTFTTFNISLPSSASSIVPCMTIENIASSMDDFYAESSSVQCSTKGTNAPMSSLAAIFDAITNSLGPGNHLIPNTLN
jgi:hypothetical protein